MLSFYLNRQRISQSSLWLTFSGVSQGLLNGTLLHTDENKGSKLDKNSKVYCTSTRFNFIYFSI